MSAFWDDYAMHLANDEFVTEFIAACERIANREIGLVECEKQHGTERKVIFAGEVETFMTPHGHCPACGAQL